MRVVVGRVAVVDRGDRAGWCRCASSVGLPSGWMRRSPWRAITSSPTHSRRPSSSVTPGRGRRCRRRSAVVGRAVEDAAFPVAAVHHRVRLPRRGGRRASGRAFGVGVAVAVGQHELAGGDEFGEARRMRPSRTASARRRSPASRRRCTVVSSGVGVVGDEPGPAAAGGHRLVLGGVADDAQRRAGRFGRVRSSAAGRGRRSSSLRRRSRTVRASRTAGCGAAAAEQQGDGVGVDPGVVAELRAASPLTAAPMTR